MNAQIAALQHRTETASALKRLVVRRCLQEISATEFDRARAEIIRRSLHDGPALRAAGSTGAAPSHGAASAAR